MQRIGTFCYFFKYFLFYILIICDFFTKSKVFMLLMVTLDKNSCKNLKGTRLLFCTNYSTISVNFFCTLKIEEFLIFTLFSALVFCNYVILECHILNISKATFPKQILDLPISYQLPDVNLQEFYVHSAYVINH